MRKNFSGPEAQEAEGKNKRFKEVNVK